MLSRGIFDTNYLLISWLDKTSAHTDAPFFCLKFSSPIFDFFLSFVVMLDDLLFLLDDHRLRSLGSHSEKILKIFQRFLAIPFWNKLIVHAWILLLQLSSFCRFCKGAQICLREIFLRNLQIFQKLLELNLLRGTL